jgi:hypothetical protein
MERIEALMRRRQPPHYRGVVQVPWDEPNIVAYLDALPCPCGSGSSYELKTFGLVVPQPLTSEDWQQQAQAYYAQRKALDA